MIDREQLSRKFIRILVLTHLLQKKTHELYLYLTVRVQAYMYLNSISA